MTIIVELTFSMASQRKEKTNKTCKICTMTVQFIFFSPIHSLEILFSFEYKHIKFNLEIKMNRNDKESLIKITARVA